MTGDRQYLKVLGMTSTYSIEYARARLGDLITAASQGHTVIITRNGKPAAQLTALPADDDETTPDDPSAQP